MALDMHSNHCIKQISNAKIWFDWQMVQKHYHISTDEENFLRNLRTNYGWIKSCKCNNKHCVDKKGKIMPQANCQGIFKGYEKIKKQKKTFAKYICDIYLLKKKNRK